MNQFARTASLLVAGTLAVGTIASLSGTQVPVPGLSAQPVGATAIAADE